MPELDSKNGINHQSDDSFSIMDSKVGIRVLPILEKFIQPS